MTIDGDDGTPDAVSRARWRRWAGQTLAEATGRRHRVDPVAPRTGGPAGNARLTAWTGLALLVLFLAEIGTLLDLDDYVSWHIAIGTLLVPPALLKTVTTGWRVLRYYTHRPAYRQAGPPPLPLRVLGPLVVVSTLALLGTGLALVAAGPEATSLLTLHKIATAAWVITTGLHTLGRILPALRIAGIGRETTPLPGRTARVVILLLTLAVAGLTATLVLTVSHPWAAGQHLTPHQATYGR
ncbi:hypothetical protein [Nonomuraea jabiensis]|uniref:hypothetical protein n=1 Tax=Nonomuraea jabiensis TaxID=882448 RepID=UPI003D73A4D2